MTGLGRAPCGVSLLCLTTPCPCGPRTSVSRTKRSRSILHTCLRRRLRVFYAKTAPPGGGMSQPESSRDLLNGGRRKSTTESSVWKIAQCALQECPHQRRSSRVTSLSQRVAEGCAHRLVRGRELNEMLSETLARCCCWELSGVYLSARPTRPPWQRSKCAEGA